MTIKVRTALHNLHSETFSHIKCFFYHKGSHIVRKVYSQNDSRFGLKRNAALGESWYGKYLGNTILA